METCCHSNSSERLSANPDVKNSQEVNNNNNNNRRPNLVIVNKKREHAASELCPQGEPQSENLKKIRKER